MNRRICIEIEEEIRQALKPIGEARGIAFDVVNGSYGTDHMSVKVAGIEISTPSQDGKDFKQLEFEKVCRVFGFKPEDYGMEFKAEGAMYQLIGLKPNARKNVCEIKNVISGAVYVAPLSYVKRGA